MKKCLCGQDMSNKEILKEFNWRWKAYLKGEYTQQQFSRDFRKYLKSN